MTKKKTAAPKKRRSRTVKTPGGEYLARRMSILFTESQLRTLEVAASLAGRRVPDHIRFILFPPEVAS